MQRVKPPRHHECLIIRLLRSQSADDLSIALKCLTTPA